MSGERARPSILIVEDDPALRAGLRTLLEREGYRAVAAADGEAALEALSDRRAPPDLVVLDLMLPGVGGLTVLKQLRRQRRELPVLVLSAKGAVPDKVTLLEAGADDYVVKPFDVAELVARLRALLKRYRKTEPRRYRSGNVEVDLDARRVARGGRPVHLTATEFAVLDALVRRAGAVVTRDEIIDRVWGLDPPESPRAIDYHVLQLRRKLGDDPERPRVILTETGLGYRVPG